MRALITKLSATGWNVNLVSLDSDSEAWLLSQGVTDITVRKRYSDFYTLCKELTPTLWSRLMMVSLRSNEAPLKTWGGGKSTFPNQLQGNFLTGGTVTTTEEGTSIASSDRWVNRITTPSGFVYSTHRAEPWFIGMVYQNFPAAGRFANSANLINWNVGTTSTFLSNYSGGDSLTPAWQTGFGIQSLFGGQFVAANSFANNSVNADQLIGIDFQSGRTSMAQLSNERYATATHASSSPNTSGVTTGLWFLPALTFSTNPTIPSGILKYLIFFSSGITDVSSEAKLFWHILRSTLLSKKQHLHFAQGGQSLSTGTLQRRLQMVLNTTRTVTCEGHSYGGTYISAWIGADPNNPVRASQYSGGFWNVSGTGTTQASWPYEINKNLGKWIIWLQGESDTELRSTAVVYQQQLQNLFGFLNEDFEGNFNMAVNLLDYAIAYRTGTTQGNFTISGFEDSGSAANGTWVITSISPVVSGGTVTNADTNYTWTKSGGGTISKNGNGEWEIAVSGIVYATSNETFKHPELCTWNFSNGATANLAFLELENTIVFSESRTGNIERVRKAQSDFVAENSNRVISFDSRGVTRPLDVGLTDAVHPDSAGETELSYRARLQMIGVLAPPTISGFAYPLETLTSTRAGQWYVDNVAVPGATGTTFQIPLFAYGKNITCEDSNILTVWKPSDITGVNVTFVSDRLTFNTVNPLILASEGQTVRQWSSSNGTVTSSNVTALNQPIFRGSGQSGNPSLEFDGADDRLTLTGGISLFRNISTGYIFVGARDTDHLGGRTDHCVAYFSNNSNTTIRFGVNTKLGASGFSAIATPSDAGSTFSASVTSDANYNVLCAEGLFSSGVLNLRVNGVQAATTSFTGTNTSDTNSSATAIGGFSTTVGNFPGHITCVITATQALSATNRSRIERFIGLIGNLNIPLV
jgi:hypothetical protein